MPCFHPLTAFQPLEGGSLIWTEKPDTRQIQIPCNQCVGCRLQRSANWATRCMHEAKSSRYNEWLTLTYDDEHLPSRYDTGLIHPVTKQTILSGSLHKPHMQKFIRALRKKINCKFLPHNPPVGGARILTTTSTANQEGASTAPRKDVARRTLRYYYGGEYGEKYHRPHYHICLFGIEFTDKVLYRKTDTGFNLYTSETITKLWPYGTHQLGELTWESAAYTARYIMKKINGKRKEKHYQKTNYETGEIITLTPEYNDMSRRPGIGMPWLAKYLTDVYPHDQVIVRGHKRRPPRAYDKYYETHYPDAMEVVKFGREIERIQNYERSTQPRLDAEERITERKITTLKQKL